MALAKSLENNTLIALLTLAARLVMRDFNQP